MKKVILVILVFISINSFCQTTSEMNFQLGDNGKTHFFFDSLNFALERASWSDHGVGDALWRTSLVLIATDWDELKKAVNSCVIDVDGKKRFLRHPYSKREDCSRDQAIMALVSLKLHDNKKYQNIISDLSFKISDRPVYWSDAWFWSKENYFMWRASSFYKFIFIKYDKSYSKHLFCWMIWSSGEEMPMLRKLMLKHTAKTNYLLRALLGDVFTEEDKAGISKLYPTNDFPWQRTTPWNEEVKLTPEQSEYNNLGLEVLNYILVKDYGLSIVNL